MTEAYVLTLAREAGEIALIIAGPILITSLVIGSLVSLIQAATQISEITLTFVPKIIAVLVIIAVFGSWMMQRLLLFTSDLINDLPNLVP